MILIVTDWIKNQNALQTKKKSQHFMRKQIQFCSGFFSYLLYSTDKKTYVLYVTFTCMYIYIYIYICTER